MKLAVVSRIKLLCCRSIRPLLVLINTAVTKYVRTFFYTTKHDPDSLYHLPKKTLLVFTTVRPWSSGLWHRVVMW